MSHYSIINSVPQNSGDLALLEAVLFYINRIDPHNSVVVYSDAPGFLNLSKLKISKNKKDLHHLPIPDSLKKPMAYLNKLLPISLNELILKNKLFFKTHKKQYYKDVLSSKFVISSPGGYLHDFYNNNERFYILEKIAKEGSLILLGQSIGPFWKEASKLKMLSILNACKHMIFRESISSKRYEQSKNINQSLCPDVAFLLHSKYQLFKQKEEPFKIEKIAISFRKWNNASNTKELISKAKELCNYLINEKSKSVTFLSTCQGLNDYTDDLLIAYEIQKDIKDKSKFKVISGYHTPFELIQLYQNYDLYFGMRMHGAILSLIGGTPAINIGYEDKSLGLFNDLGIKEYYVDYKKDVKDWKQRYEYIENNYKSYATSISTMLDQSNVKILNTLDKIF